MTTDLDRFLNAPNPYNPLHRIAPDLATALALNGQTTMLADVLRRAGRPTAARWFETGEARLDINPHGNITIHVQH